MVLFDLRNIEEFELSAACSQLDDGVPSNLLALIASRGLVLQIFVLSNTILVVEGVPFVDDFRPNGLHEATTISQLHETLVLRDQSDFVCSLSLVGEGNKSGFTQHATGLQSGDSRLMQSEGPGFRRTGLESRIVLCCFESQHDETVC